MKFSLGTLCVRLTWSKFCMVGKMFKRITAALIGLGILGASVPALASSTPELYVVMFRAEWCGPCKIVEPKLDKALRELGDPTIEYVTIDITTPGLSEMSAHRAFDRNIVQQYNGWMGVTGFAAIIDADTKQTLGCINMVYDASAMRMHIKNLKTYAVTNQSVQDVMCPDANYL